MEGQDSRRLSEIPGFSGYFVGDDGSVWSAKIKGGCRLPGRTADALRLLKIVRDRKGYCRVNLDLNGKNYSKLVHQLVLAAFAGPRPPGMESCHYPDYDKTNNRISNLRWDTHAENSADAYRHQPAAVGKTCRRCQQHKPVSEFYADRRASDGLKGECKSCHCTNAYATADKEKRRNNNRELMRRSRANEQAS